MTIRVDIRSYNNDGEEFTYEISERANYYEVGEKGSLNLFLRTNDTHVGRKLIQTYAPGNWFSVRILEDGETE